jgi:hypothetical protein
MIALQKWTIRRLTVSVVKRSREFRSGKNRLMISGFSNALGPVIRSAKAKSGSFVEGTVSWAGIDAGSFPELGRAMPAAIVRITKPRKISSGMKFIMRMQVFNGIKARRINFTDLPS